MPTRLLRHWLPKEVSLWGGAFVWQGERAVPLPEVCAGLCCPWWGPALLRWVITLTVLYQSLFNRITRRVRKGVQTPPPPPFLVPFFPRVLVREVDHVRGYPYPVSGKLSASLPRLNGLHPIVKHLNWNKQTKDPAYAIVYNHVLTLT